MNVEEEKTRTKNVEEEKTRTMNVEEEKTRTMNVEEKIQKLVEEIHRLGSVQPDGSYEVTFGVLLNDDRCANIFEALVDTLIAAKECKIVLFEGELLLPGGNGILHTEVILPRPPRPPLPRLSVAATS